MPQHPPPARPIRSDPVQIRFLGPFSLVGNGTLLPPFPYVKIQALLAYLALSPGIRHSRESLAELLWPAVDGEQARGNLRRALFELRRTFAALGPDPIRADRDALSFEAVPGLQWDTAELEAAPLAPATPEAARAAARAVALYRGSFLEDLRLPDALEFSHWLHGQRERFRQRALDLLQGLIRHHESRRQWDEAIACSRQRLLLAPWQEQNARQLIALLADRGRLGEALQVFQDCRRYLERELGLEPEQETLALAARLNAAQPAPEPPPAAGPARFPITVLACRLNVDAEHPAAAAATTAAADLWESVVAGHNGHSVALTATLLTAYFGYPLPRENALHEAIGAALALRGALAAAGTAAAMGLDSGWTVSDGRYSLPDASGHICNRAIALAQQGRDGEVLLPGEVFSGLEARFDGEALADGVHRITGRRDPASGDGPLPLIGRRTELHALLDLWQEALQGALSVVHVAGEAGMGKSRLVQALVRRVQGPGRYVRELRCLEEERHTPYFPLAETLRRHLGDPPNLPPAQRQERLRQRVERHHPELRPHLAVVNRLLGLPSELDAIAFPPALKERIESGLLALLADLLRRGPLLLVMEDAHWADSATLELLTRLDEVRQAGDRRPLLLATTSRTAEPPVPGTPVLRLGPLNAEESRELAQRAGATRGLDRPALDGILARADGVPLYLEQMALGRGLDPASDAIPPTLRDLLASRIAALGPHLGLAQAAAVIGREFDPALLAFLLGGDGASLRDGLAALQAQGLIHAEDGQPAFRHALIRDAAYHSLPAARRKELHLRLARALQAHCREQLRQRPELAARHLAEAGHEEAAGAWLQAATHAARASVPGQARHYYEAGLAALAFVADPAQRSALEFRLQVGLGNVLIALGGYGNEKAKQVFSHALALGETLPPGDLDRFAVMWGIWLGGRSIDSTVSPLEFARRLEHAAGDNDDPRLRLQLAYAWGNNFFWLGRLDESRRQLETALALAPRVDPQEMIARYGEDSSIPARAFLAWIDWLQGDPETARARAEETIALARTLGHAHSLGFAVAFAAVLYRHFGLVREARALGLELAELSARHGLGLWQAVAVTVLGWAAACEGDTEGIALLRQGVGLAQHAMSSVETTFLSFLVEAHCRLGQLDEAEAVARDAIGKALVIQDHYFRPELLRLRGEALRLRHGTAKEDEAMACFEEGMALAETHGSAALCLRLAMSQAAALARRGRDAEGHALLRQWCPPPGPGDWLPDHQAARHLLRQLARGAD